MKNNLSDEDQAKIGNFNGSYINKNSDPDLGRRTILNCKLNVLDTLIECIHKIHKETLDDVNITLCAHITAETAQLSLALVDLGAKVNLVSCNRFTASDDVAHALAEYYDNVKVFGWSNMSESQFFQMMKLGCNFPSSKTDQWLILDDGGSLTSSVLNSAQTSHLIGIIEESSSGNARIHHRKPLNLPAPYMNLTRSIVKQKIENTYFPRESFVQCLRVATGPFGKIGSSLFGRRAAVVGFGHVGKEVAKCLHQCKMSVVICETDPICAMQAVMEGYPVCILANIAHQVDLIVGCTGSRHVINFPILEKTKDGCTICSMSHIGIDEIDIEKLDTNSIDIDEVTNFSTKYTLPNDHEIFILCNGEPINWSIGDTPENFIAVTACLQILACLELKSSVGLYENLIYAVPRSIDELTAKIYTQAMEGKVTHLTNKEMQEQGFQYAQNGGHKSLHYNY